LRLDLSGPMAATGVFDGAGYDLSVDNAGRIRREGSVDLARSDWDEVMDVPLEAVFGPCQAACQARMARSGEGQRACLVSDG